MIPSHTAESQLQVRQQLVSLMPSCKHSGTASMLSLWKPHACKMHLMEVSTAPQTCTQRIGSNPIVPQGFSAAKPSLLLTVDSSLLLGSWVKKSKIAR